MTTEPTEAKGASTTADLIVRSRSPPALYTREGVRAFVFRVPTEAGPCV